MVQLCNTHIEGGPVEAEMTRIRDFSDVMLSQPTT